MYAIGLPASGHFAIGVINTDVSGPALMSAAIIAPALLRINFSEAVRFGAAGGNDMTISLSGGGASLTYLSGSGTSTLRYSISRSVGTSETGSVVYVQPGGGIEDMAGNELATTSSVSLSNAQGRGRAFSLQSFNSAFNSRF